MNKTERALLRACATTLGGGIVVLADFGADQSRGVVALDMPRKKIHSVDISFRISKLPRKQPSAILGGRDYGEENATQRQTRRIREALAKKGKRK